MIGTDFYEILFRLNDISAYENKYSKEELDFFRNEYDFIYKQFKNTFILTAQSIIEQVINNIFNPWVLTIKDYGYYNTHIGGVMPMKWSIDKIDATLSAGTSAATYWDEIDHQLVEDIKLNEDIDIHNIDYPYLVSYLYNYLLDCTDATPIENIIIKFNKNKNELDFEETKFVDYITNLIQNTNNKYLKGNFGDNLVITYLDN